MSHCKKQEASRKAEKISPKDGTSIPSQLSPNAEWKTETMNDDDSNSDSVDGKNIVTWNMVTKSNIPHKTHSQTNKDMQQQWQKET